MTLVMTKIEPQVLVEHGVRQLLWRGTPFPGRVIVFLHGLGDGADVWRPVMRNWPDGPVTSIAIDFPGHGGTEFHDPKDYSVPKFARWLADVLARNGIRNPVLVGHSMGARVALEAAQMRLIDPAHVVVVDVSPDAKADDDKDINDAIREHLGMLAAGAPSIDSFRQKIAARMQLADRETLAELVPALVAAAGSTEAPGARLRLDPQIDRLLEAPNEVDGWAALAALGCPATIIRGEFSSALSKETALKMQQSLRKPAGCITIPKAGHAIPFEQSAALSSAIAQGLRGGL